MTTRDTIRGLIVRLRLGVVCTLVPICGCAQPGPTAPESISASTLTASPTTVVIEGQTLTLAASLWRDFQPISPPDGKPMIAGLQVQSLGGSAVPATVTADTVWLVHGTDVWSGVAREERSRQDTAPVYEVVARDGPKWGPGVLVDVILQLRHASGRVSRLRVANQLVRATF